MSLTQKQIEEIIQETIVKSGNQWCVKSKKGKNLGCSTTKASAYKRLGQVEYFKSINESVDIDKDSGMIAIMMPEEVQNKVKELDLLKNKGSVEVSTLHSTLIYLGDTSKIDLDKVKEIISKVVKNYNPLNAKLGGFGKFSPGDDGIPYFATVSAKGLSQLQSELEKELENIIDIPTEHGFVPHMTLGYMEKDDDLPSLDNIKLPEWKVDKISLVIGDDVKEEYSLKNDLDESSGMSGGGMAFSPGKQKDYKMIDRKEFIEEMKLRENIQNILKRIITEAKNKEDRIPHQSTGINILEDLLKKIIPALEDDYKDLTTSPEQRKSFKAHIVNAVMNDIQREQTKPSLEDQEDEMSLNEDIDVSLSDNDIENDVELGSDEEDENKFIDIENPTGGIQGNKKSEEDEEIDRFTISGEDETGRNMALETFNTIQKNIMDSYHLLGNEEDIELFTDYLITNLKMYFDKWEDELQTSVPELTTDEYEDKKDNLGSDSVDFGSDDEDTGLEDEISI